MSSTLGKNECLKNVWFFFCYPFLPQPHQQNTNGTLRNEIRRKKKLAGGCGEEEGKRIEKRQAPGARKKEGGGSFPLSGQ